ncbi:hypothetical protein ACTJKQ_16090 [Acidovorax sp. 22279]|uniref:hypothetical protein n=1 Tax=Acidovorax sp. 22279 TaxID=3453900 RepID=UPI003F875D2D
MKVLFAAACALVGAFFLYLSFVSAPPQTWTLSELAYGAVAYGPMFGSALLAVFGFRKALITLPWLKLAFMSLFAAMAFGAGYNAAGALFGLASTVLAWIMFVQLLRLPAIEL